MNEQQFPKPLTDETIAMVEQISLDLGESPSRIAQERELMERMKDPLRDNIQIAPEMQALADAIRRGSN